MTKTLSEMTWQAYYRQLVRRRHTPKSFLIRAMIARSNRVLRQLATPIVDGKYTR